MSNVATQLRTPEDLEQYRAEVLPPRRPRGPGGPRLLRAGLHPKGAKVVYDRFRRGSGKTRRSNRPRRAESHRLPGPLPARPDRHVDPGRVFYQEVKEEDVAGNLARIGARRPRRRAIAVRDRRQRQRRTHGGRDSLLPGAAADRAGLLRRGRCPTSIDDYHRRRRLRKRWPRCSASMTPGGGDRARSPSSGLRGRGGGGFLTGRKWRSARHAPGEPKYVIANGDEGDPGAFMDRCDHGRRTARRPRRDDHRRLSRSAPRRGTSTCATNTRWPSSA